MKDENLAIAFGKKQLVRRQDEFSDDVRAEEPGPIEHKRRKAGSWHRNDSLDPKMITRVLGRYRLAGIPCIASGNP
jgi:hypothetical protein